MTAQTPPAARPASNRERILDYAETAVLEKGFAATSIDELIAAVGITKSGFFYHFADKSALAKALMQRHLAREETLFDDLFGRAKELTDDPLHAYLVGLKLLAEMMADLPTTHPGCLVAACCYQDRIFDREVRDMNASGVLGWRARFRRHLDHIAEQYPPCIPVDLDTMADMLTALIEGAIILSRVTRNPAILADQILHYRSFVKTVFAGTPRS